MVRISNFVLPLPLFALIHGFPGSFFRNLPRADLPAAFFLAGDSTTAPSGGWGDGFLTTTLANGAWGTNFAKSGATTVSFRNGGYWDSTIEAVKNVTANGDYTAWVTIQFGHNDQKASANITTEEFATNLGVFVDEVLEAGGNPILVSSLTRRAFENGTVIENLAEVAAAALEVAEEKGVLSIDLNRASTDYCNEIGEDDSQTYNLDGTDRTHLNDAGEVVFGNMVAWLLDNSDEGETLSQYTVAGDAYAEAFESGTYIAE
ncbi:putative gdsl-like lipase acylhydrolase protein [Lasiodiplodia theobromae]|uniref:Gdsl-like lipase acylhydrolase protein n=1 Tax=Lasiodiplodia theobromae TaxID=45133 RepID=A0A5N5DEU1_9PEZI|nr:Gdsl-like lipase acylhydrolase [Lasiodiplodia theobromae]KAB2576366.1 Rhamnogalacturonan acetylesterase RhgT [Lasiodiplodia theobromae]KAF4544036.1 Gdsl-like lipase acylhydrolase [Lasiodiplodia theobromae]KAF9629190.1 putative gdsl-like lipase acylhydrolase protein [Lasiodiplodia theobromae]